MVKIANFMLYFITIKNLTCDYVGKMWPDPI